MMATKKSEVTVSYGAVDLVEHGFFVSMQEAEAWFAANQDGLRNAMTVAASEFFNNEGLHRS